MESLHKATMHKCEDISEVTKKEFPIVIGGTFHVKAEEPLHKL